MSTNDLHKKSTSETLGELFKAEARSIDESQFLNGPKSEAWFHISRPGAANEPWVEKCARDRFGLALSGGGIRSATFNLGVFQALAKLGLLSRIDYLSTVSGGGYIGGWYSAWKNRSTRWTFEKDEILDPESIKSDLQCETPAPNLEILSDRWHKSAHSKTGKVLDFLNETVSGAKLSELVPNKSAKQAPAEVQALLSLESEDADHAQLVRLLLEQWFGTEKLAPLPSPPDFPETHKPKESGSARDEREATEIRHLREFSRFLVPRMGLFNVDMWHALSTILAGTVPAILTALSVLIIGICGWLLIGSPVARVEQELWPFGVVVGTLLFLLLTELRFQKLIPKGSQKFSSLHYGFCAAMLLGILFLVCQLVPGASMPDRFGTLELRDTLLPIDPVTGASKHPATPTVEPFDSTATNLRYTPNLPLMVYPGLLWSTLLLLIFLRPVLSKYMPATAETHQKRNRNFQFFQAFERLIGRVFALGLAWLGLVGTWEFSCWLVSQPAPLLSLFQPGGTAITSTTLFVALRRWFLEQNPTDTGSDIPGHLGWLKPILPRILAYTALISVVIFLMSSLILCALKLSEVGSGKWIAGIQTKRYVFCIAAAMLLAAGSCAPKLLHAKWNRFCQWRKNPKGTKPSILTLISTNCHYLLLLGIPVLYVLFIYDYLQSDPNAEVSVADVFRLLIFVVFSIAIILVCFAVFFFDTARIGLHDFYRSRISRAFLGASAGKNRSHAERRLSTEAFSDDLRLSKLVGQRPVHLICCAANDQNSDRLTTLYRGARSATLSGLGVSMAGKWLRLRDLRFSSALTASAAAFNSVMGTQSIRLGKPVSFLLTALNLRLGLWVPNPHARPHHKESLPGLNFLREMFVATKASVNSSPNQEDQVKEGEMIHLSDGGHFENLALYELVRRHCRYIVVSDVGADPFSNFSDLGNAIRRVREDFGVEIELILAPLISNDEGKSEQHLVIGTVHYDGVDGVDKGILIYLKPTITGDEPFDVLQYKNRSSSFPHDTTVDQFYDESQWEAYRRLGEHTALAAFSNPLSGRTLDKEATLSKLFQQYRDKWYPTPKDFTKNFLNLTARFNEVERNVRATGSPSLKQQFFHEPNFESTEGASNTKATVDDAYLLMQVCQFLEDVWLGCQLDDYWSHPLNRGWVNYLHRWSGCPIFNYLWPFLSPLYSVEFRRFMSRRFGLSDLQRRQSLAEMSIEIFAYDTKGDLPQSAPELDRLLPKSTPPRGNTERTELEAILQWALPGVNDRITLGALRIRLLPDEQERFVAQWDMHSFRCAPGYVDTEVLIFFFDKLTSNFSEYHRDKRVSVSCFEAVISTDPRKAKIPDMLLHTNKELVDRIAILKRLGFSFQASSKDDQPHTLLRLKADSSEL